MSITETVDGTKVGVFIGNGATPTELFTRLCGLTSRNFNQTVNTNDFVLPLCGATGLPQRHVFPVSEQNEISGDAFFYKAEQTTLHAAKGVVKNYQFVIDNVTYQGAAMLTAINITGTDGEKATASVTFQSHGAWTRTVV
jgi:Phage tail tube protein